MSFLREVSPDKLRQESRRGARVNSRVPIRIEWAGEKGVARSEPGHTRVVSYYGCLVVGPFDLPLGRPLRLINLATQESIEATVIWKAKQEGGEFEAGIELVKPENDFWGLEL